LCFVLQGFPNDETLKVHFNNSHNQSSTSEQDNPIDLSRFQGERRQDQSLTLFRIDQHLKKKRKLDDPLDHEPQEASTSGVNDALMASMMTFSTMKSHKSHKDDNIPSGYLRFRFNEDCEFQNCGYRNHQSHFHCCRKDCFYSFCDKTRFVQHTARHERLDKLMGDDFKQYRAGVSCEFDDCMYNNTFGKSIMTLKFSQR
jgi:hypothetical protein